MEFATWLKRKFFIVHKEVLYSLEVKTRIKEKVLRIRNIIYNL